MKLLVFYSEIEKQSIVLIFLIKFKHAETNFLRLFDAIHVEETISVAFLFVIKKVL